MNFYWTEESLPAIVHYHWSADSSVELLKSHYHKSPQKTTHSGCISVWSLVSFLCKYLVCYSSAYRPSLSSISLTAFILRIKFLYLSNLKHWNLKDRSIFPARLSQSMSDPSSITVLCLVLPSRALCSAVSLFLCQCSICTVFTCFLEPTLSSAEEPTSRKNFSCDICNVFCLKPLGTCSFVSIHDCLALP